MEAIAKDLSKLESKSCGPALLSGSLQDSIEALERWKAALLAEDCKLAIAAWGKCVGALFEGIADRRSTYHPSFRHAPCFVSPIDNEVDDTAAGQTAVQEVQNAATKLGELQKEWSSATTKYGKSVEKVRRWDGCDAWETKKHCVNSSLTYLDYASCSF